MYLRNRHFLLLLVLACATTHSEFIIDQPDSIMQDRDIADVPSATRPNMQFSSVLLDVLSSPPTTFYQSPPSLRSLPAWMEYLIYTILIAVLQTLVAYVIRRFFPDLSNRLYSCLPEQHRNLLGPMLLTFVLMFTLCLFPRCHRILRPIDPVEVNRNEELHHLRRENASLRREIDSRV